MKIYKSVLLFVILILMSGCTLHKQAYKDPNINSYYSKAVAKDNFLCLDRPSGVLVSTKYSIKKGQQFGLVDMTDKFIPGATGFSEKTYFPKHTVGIVIEKSIGADVVLAIYPDGTFATSNGAFVCRSTFCREGTGGCDKLEGGNFEIINR